MKPRPSSVTFTYPKPSCVPGSTKRRFIHSSRPGHASVIAPSQDETAPSEHYPPSAPKAAPLSCLPLSQVLRTYLITSISSSPTLLNASTKSLIHMLDSKSWLTSVERNPILRLALRETFYKQFCAGSNRPEIKQCMQGLHSVGFQGAILEYALEVLKDVKGADEVKDVETWRRALLETVDTASPGDFVGLKWSGLGSHALQRLMAGEKPSKLMDDAMREVCESATSKKVKLLPAAEEAVTTPMVDAWSLNLQQDFNKGANGSVVYNTYQAYLKSTPGTIATHLADAQKKNYTLGLKLVRGAYLGTEVRSLIWSTIEETHAAYDGIAASLIKRQYEGPLRAITGKSSKDFPQINVVLATHNAATVRKAMALRSEQTRQKQPKVPLAYAQLQGMADEVSCELLQAGKANPEDAEFVDIPQVYKCTTWGTMTECLNYLIRRAAENKDAAGRTRESRKAMGAELRRRMMVAWGLA